MDLRRSFNVDVSKRGSAFGHPELHHPPAAQFQQICFLQGFEGAHGRSEEDIRRCSLFGYVNTRLNFDLLTYLPESFETVAGQNILLEDFGKGAFSFIIAEGMSDREVSALRQEGVYAEFDVVGRSVKAQMKYANKIGAKFTMVLGDSELETGKAMLKNMETGEQQERALDTFGGDFMRLSISESLKDIEALGVDTEIDIDAILNTNLF